jgi:hypothetical protein
VGTGVVSNNGARLIANNGAALIGDRGGGLIAEAGAGLTGTNANAKASGGTVAPYLRVVPGTRLPGELQAQRPPGSTPALFWGKATGEPLTWGVLSQPPTPPLQAKADPKGRFEFEDLEVATAAVLVAGLSDSNAGYPPEEFVHFVVQRGENPLRLTDADGALGTYLVARLLHNEASPVAALYGMAEAGLGPARRAVAAAWARETARPAMNGKALVTALDGWLARDEDLASALDALRLAALRAVRAELGLGRAATTVALPAIRGLAAAPDGAVALALDAQVWRLPASGVLEPVLGTGQQAHALPPDGLPADQLALAPEGPLAHDAQGRLLGVVYEPRTGQQAILRREADGTLKTLVRWEPAAVGQGPPEALTVAPGGRLTLWTRATSATAPGLPPEGGGLSGRRWASTRALALLTPVLRQLPREAPSQPVLVTLRAWHWEPGPSGPSAAPTQGEEARTPEGAPPGSDHTWRLKDGRLQRVGLDGTVLEPGTSLPDGERWEGWTRWVRTADGTVLAASGSIVWRLANGSVSRVAGRLR